MSLSRFTDPGRFAWMLEELPTDPRSIALVARAQTVHHNLLPHFGIPRNRWQSIRRVWPPYLEAILEALSEIDPRTLSEARRPEQRVLGACVLESYVLAGLLRDRGHRVRIRVGYFENIRRNAEHVVAFWERVRREKGIDSEDGNAYTRRQNQLDHRIEHWICEVWDENARGWRLLDANDEFLRAHSRLDVDVYLAREHFENAHEAWLHVRAGDCDPDRYREDEQDGRSHARSQLLWELASLLNHDGAGLDDRSGRDYAFIKQQTYDETTVAELNALDELARLLAEDRIDDLAKFYAATPALRIDGAERDQYSLVARRGTART